MRIKIHIFFFIYIFNLSTPFSFTILRRFLSFLQETTFENIMANGGIALKLYAISVLSVKESFHIIYYMPLKSSAVDLTYVGNGLNLPSNLQQTTFEKIVTKGETTKNEGKG